MAGVTDFTVKIADAEPVRTLVERCLALDDAAAEFNLAFVPPDVREAFEQMHAALYALVSPASVRGPSDDKIGVRVRIEQPSLDPRSFRIWLDDYQLRWTRGVEISMGRDEVTMVTLTLPVRELSLDVTTAVHLKALIDGATSS